MGAHDTHLTQTGVEVQALLDKIEDLGPIPTALSDLTDDSTHRVVTDTEKSEWNAKYDKPASGIPASDMESGAIPENVLQYSAQTLSSAQQEQARTNIGAGTSNFSGSFNDLTNKPDVPENIWKSGTGTDSATTVGGQNEASGTRAVAEGYRTAAKGQEAHSEGRYTSAIGDRSHAEGLGTTANFSVSGSANATTLTTNYVNSLYTGDVICYKSGNDEVYAYIVSVDAQNNTITLNKALSDSALSSANVTKLTGAAVGPRAHSEGYGAEAYGTDSHAEGYFSCALGNQAHAEGGETVAAGQYSHAEGTGSRTKNAAEHAEGMFNVSSDASGEKTIHTVGIGTGDNDRKNAEAILTNGDKYLVGVGSYDGTTFSGASTVQSVINAKYEKPVGGIPASDMASGVIPDAVEANPTVPAGTTPTSLTGLKIGSDYYDIEAGGGTVTDVTVGGTSVVDGNGVAVVPAIPTVNDATLTIKMNNASKGTFSANAASNTEIDLGTVITSHQDISGKADKVSGATNGHFAGLDSNGNLTDSGKGASDFGTYSKPSGGIPASDLASGVIPDVSNFITKSVNDLVNYYTKTETYTQAEVQSLIGAIQSFHYEIYASTSAVTNPQGNVLYLIGPTGSGSDRYEEYVYTSNTWTKIGDTSIDLSDYVTSTALNTALSAYTTTANLNTLLAAKQDVIDDLADIRSGASAGATAYQKPANGIPASDLAAGVVPDVSGKEDKTNKVSAFQVTPDDTHYPTEKLVKDSLDAKQPTIDANHKLDYSLLSNTPTIPTVPTDIVKYTAQSLTDAQKSQARSNIGAGTYSLPANGIPKTDLAQAVRTTLDRADAAIIYTSLGEPDWEEYDYDIAAFLTTLRETGYYSFTMDEEYVFYVTVQAIEMDGYTYVYQQYWGSEEGPANVYYRAFVYDDDNDEVVSDNDMSYISLQQASDLFANKNHNHYTNVRGTASVWSYCDTMQTLDATSEVVYTDSTTSTQWLIEGAYAVYQPAVRYQKVTPLQGGTCYYQRCGTVASNTVTWGPWYRFDTVEANPTVPAGTTPTSLTGLKIGSDYYDIEAGGGTVTDVTVGGTSVVDGNGVAVVPAIPTVNDATLTIKMNNASKGTFSANAASNTEIDLGTVITSHQDISGKADKVNGATNGHFAGLDSNGNLTDSGKGASDFGTYSKPSGGIPASDLDSAVQTSLGKADTALQSFTETDPTVPSWAKASSKPSYDYSEIGNTPSLATVATSGSYNDLSNTPTIPTVPTDIVKYTEQTLTAEQQAQARSNIGAGTYSKPSGGIPASDMANDSMFVRGNSAIWQGTSITSAATAAKTASVSNFLSSDLAVGVMVVVTFSNTNIAAPNLLTLNVSSRGAKPIKRWVNGGLADIDKPENLTGTMAFVYDGTNWVTWYESFDDVDGDCINAKFGNVTLNQWKPDYTMIEGSYVKGADGLLYEYSGSKYVEVAVGDAERVRFLGIYPKYSSWTNGFAFGKYENDQWVTIESEKFGYDTSQDASITMEYIRAVPSGATHFRTSSATSSLLALERNFYLYFQTGKPAVSQEELEDAVNPPIGTTQPNGGFLPNKVYDLGTLTGTVTFALAAPTDNTRPNPYHWTFETGATAPTINWPSGLTWLGGAPPDPEASKHYEIMVRNGYASALVFDLPTS